MLLTFQLQLHFLYHFRNSFLESTSSQQRKRNQQHGSSTTYPRDLFCTLSPFFTPILASNMAAQTAIANLPPSPASKAALRRENKRILATHKTVDKWTALCAWEDDVSTEVVLESVDITKKEKCRLMFKMVQRVLRQITEYEDIEQQEHDMPVPLWYAKRRGSSCSSQSAGSVASRGSGASADVGDGGFKPCAKEEGAVGEDSDVWRFGRSAREEQPSEGESANRQKEKRQPSTGTCNPQ